MQFTAFVASIMALAAGANAAAITPRLAHLGDLRTFGAEGCFEKNQGVYTELSDEVGDCQPFNTQDAVLSLNVTDMRTGCRLFVFTNDDCTVEHRGLNVGDCTNAYGDSQFKTFKIECTPGCEEGELCT